MMDNQVQGTSVFDDFPTYDEWIIPFELDNPDFSQSCAAWEFLDRCGGFFILALLYCGGFCDAVSGK